jgi:hypothetical protein
VIYSQELLYPIREKAKAETFHYYSVTETSRGTRSKDFWKLGEFGERAVRDLDYCGFALAGWRYFWFRTYGRLRLRAYWMFRAPWYVDNDGAWRLGRGSSQLSFTG